MNRWFATGFQLILLRSAPQELPGARSWTLIALGIYLLVGLFLLELRGEGEALFYILALDLAIVVGFVALLLGVNGYWARIPQTLQALWLSGAILGLVALPFAPVAAGAGEEPETIEALAIIAGLVVMFWSVPVMAHILRHALEWPFHRAMALAIIYFLLNVIIHIQVFAGD